MTATFRNMGSVEAFFDEAARGRHLRFAECPRLADWVRSAGPREAARRARSLPVAPDASPDLIQPSLWDAVLADMHLVAVWYHAEGRVSGIGLPFRAALEAAGRRLGRDAR